MMNRVTKLHLEVSQDELMVQDCGHNRSEHPAGRLQQRTGKCAGIPFAR